VESFKSRNACFLKALFSNIFQKWQRKVYLLLVILLLLIFSSPVYAAVEGFVVKDSNGEYYQYCYQALLDSYALKLLGRSDGLYEDFAVKNPAAVLNSSGSYICYNAVLDQYTLALLGRRSFNLSQYLGSSKAKKAAMPDALNLVTLSEGRIVRATKNLCPDVLNVSGPTASVSQPAPASPVTVTPLLSATQVTVVRAQQWAASKGAHQRFIDIAPLYWEYGRRTGLCPEVLYAQAAYETHYGRFTGIVLPEYNNWAGIKIASSNGDNPEDHERFATPEDGVRAHFNHIAAYTGLNPLGEPHGRYHVILRMPWAGTVKTLEELSGKWAPSPTYHQRIVTMLEEMNQ
jgi:hypothetical protein